MGNYVILPSNWVVESLCISKTKTPETQEAVVTIKPFSLSLSDSHYQSLKLLISSSLSLLRRLRLRLRDLSASSTHSSSLLCFVFISLSAPLCPVSDGKSHQIFVFVLFIIFFPRFLVNLFLVIYVFGFSFHCWVLWFSFFSSKP